MPLITVLVNNLSDKAAISNYLDGLGAIGAPRDPRGESFRPWANYARRYDGHTVWRSNFLFSPYQLLLAHRSRSRVERLRWRRERRPFSNLNYSYRLPLSKSLRTEVTKDSEYNDELVMLLTALETKYRPGITGRVTNLRGGSLNDWAAYDKHFDPVAMLHWLRKTPEEIIDHAKLLLTIADNVDPLRDWISLIRLLRPEKWGLLRGDALIAMDHRIASEILLRFYEDLVAAGRASRLESGPMRFRGPYDTRLGTDRYELTQELMDFGISPQPSLLLVLEGQTEMALVPRVMETLGVPTKGELIKVFNSKGIDKKMNLLAEYVATPELGKAIAGGFLLTRPPTRFLRVVDPEGRMVSRAKREEHRRVLVREIWEAMTQREDLQIPIREIDPLVEVKTWNRKGESFEFAHFTDLQIAKAILNAYQGPSAPDLAELAQQVKIKRQVRQNIETIWCRWKGRKPTKGRIAEALWPALERRVLHALSSGTYRRIPVVRILLGAVERARSVHRHGVFIRTKKHSKQIQGP